MVHDTANDQCLLQRTINKIVFQAAILQPPFFNLNFDHAGNYGGIGAGIGHERSHGFDDKRIKFGLPVDACHWRRPISFLPALSMDSRNTG